MTELAPAGMWRNKISNGGWKSGGEGAFPVTEKATGEVVGTTGLRVGRRRVRCRGDCDQCATRLGSDTGTFVANSVGKGAKNLDGRTRDGLFFNPTVMVDVAPGMPAFEEEIFGPVAAVTVFKDDDEAVRLANQNRYGLVAALASSDLRRAQQIADRLHAGIVHINDQTVRHEVFGPMGGLGLSGNGHNYSTLTNADQFTEWQWVTCRENLPAYPFRKGGSPARLIRRER